MKLRKLFPVSSPVSTIVAGVCAVLFALPGKCTAEAGDPEVKPPAPITPEALFWDTFIASRRFGRFAGEDASGSQLDGATGQRWRGWGFAAGDDLMLVPKRGIERNPRFWTSLPENRDALRIELTVGLARGQWAGIAFGGQRDFYQNSLALLIDRTGTWHLRFWGARQDGETPVLDLATGRVRTGSPWRLALQYDAETQRVTAWIDGEKVVDGKNIAAAGNQGRLPFQHRTYALIQYVKGGRREFSGDYARYFAVVPSDAGPPSASQGFVPLQTEAAWTDLPRIQTEEPARNSAFSDVGYPARTTGVVDVTRPPYNAIPDDGKDDTAAINAALRDHNAGVSEDNLMTWTVFIPAGTYHISDTLVPRDKHEPWKNQCGVRILGAGLDKTVLRLADNALGFDSPTHPKYVLRTGNNEGAKPNAGFANYISHLTVKVGAGNPGAIGVRYDVANIGAMRHVRIVSLDPEGLGFAGLGFFGVCGIGYVQDVTIEGFDHGIYFDRHTVNNLALENIRLRNQGINGIRNVGKNIQIRDLTSHNRGPAIQTEDDLAVVTLIEAELYGPGEGAAIELGGESCFYGRDVRSHDYDKTVNTSEAAAKPDVVDSFVEEWWSEDAPYMNERSHESLRLPIQPAPHYIEPDDNLWASAADFGITSEDDSDDDATAIQAAIDSGKPVVCVPRGRYTLKSDVIIRGAVRRVDFLFSRLQTDEEAQIRIGDVDEAAVVVENIGRLTHGVELVYDSASTAAVRNVGPFLLRCGPAASGKLFVENVGPHARIKIGPGVHAWLRAINRERPGFLNDGGVTWYFADNIERFWNKPGQRFDLNPIKTINGGTTEFIGGAIDPLHYHHPEGGPAVFESANSTISVTVAGEIRRRDRQWGRFPLFVRDEHGDRVIRITDEELVYRTWISSDGLHGARRYFLPMYSTPARFADDNAPQGTE